VRRSESKLGLVLNIRFHLLHAQGAAEHSQTDSKVDIEMSGAPHLGGSTAIALFVVILAAFVVQSSLTQVCGIVIRVFCDADVDQACTNLTRVSTTILTLVSPISLDILLRTRCCCIL
jgi:hypothetical protein